MPWSRSFHQLLYFFGKINQQALKDDRSYNFDNRMKEMKGQRNDPRFDKEWADKSDPTGPYDFMLK